MKLFEREVVMLTSFFRLGATTLSYAVVTTAIRRPFDCLSKVTKVTVTQPASRSHADLFMYLGRSAAAHTR